MKIYLVGGAVRDKLLGITPKERDWVVVGSNQEELLKLGYKQVGKQFPVFLHPKTSEEYALARVERKIGKGHKAFRFNTNEKVSLEEDLKRRDLTINAIAQDEKDKLIDPFNGISDIENRIFRHVSDAFSEDPLRVFRVARFYATLKEYEFKIHDSTVETMKKIVESGEIDFLSKERLWGELSEAFNSKNPWMFFQALIDINFSKFYCPELTNDENLKNKVLYFSKKGIDKNIFLSICGFSVDLIELFGFPKRILDLYFLFNEFSPKFIILDMNAREILNFLNEIDAFRRPEKLKTLMQQVQFFLEFHGKEEKERFEIFESVYEFISGKIEYGDLKKLEVGEIKNRVESTHLELIKLILNKKTN